MADLNHAIWRKSSYSNANGCVEVAFVDGHVAIRDSKDRHGPVLVFTPVEWNAFLGGARDGEFDLPAHQ
jgi:prepilin-type processing-associated H-X9-DG protein